ncbi:MAG: uroporphyrinogen-III synthase [Magnetococcales bacterium]|nr:uroporphyrinogen-III synthase [Magnetococcales bacterium]
MSLVNRLILITRPEPGATETARLLHEQGAVALVAPLMIIAPVEDPALLHEALARLSSYDAVLLTSANGARCFSAALPAGITPPPLFAVGHKSASLLKARGWPVQVPDQPMGGEMLGAWLMQQMPAAKKVLFLRAEDGREEMIELLTRAGKEIETIPVYRSLPQTRLPDAVIERLPDIDAIPFFSPRSAELFFELLSHTPATLAPHTLIVALSPLTAATLRQKGIRVDLLAKGRDDQGVVDALADYWERSEKPPSA